MLKIFLLRIKNTNWTSLDQQLLHFVSKERQNKIARTLFASDKKLCLYSELIVKMELSLQLSVPFEKLIFSHTTTGKPYLFSNEKIYFNFSHSHNCILLGISDLDEVGVDIEEIQKPPVEIMDIVFHQIEKQYIATDKKLDRNRFFRIWTQKESLLKYWGTGLLQDPQYINTLDPKYSQNFVTWQFNQYSCSIFTTVTNNYEYMILSEKNIATYFLSR